MEYTNLGSTGLKVSRICLGAMTFGSPRWRDWVLDEAASRPLIKRALDLGINFFDTADVYSLGESEAVLGRALKEIGPSRDRLVIATKVNSPMGDDPNQRGLSRKHIRHSIDDSLRRLGTDYVDLYQIHRFDPNTPIEETLDALNEVVKAGKALYLGASSMYAWQFAKMLHTSDRLGLSRFVAMQNHYNLVYREEEREVIPLCRSEGIGVIPWSPLARGFLVGNRSKDGKGETARSKSDEFAQRLYFQDSDFAVVEKVTEIAAKRGVPNAQVALAWLLQQPGVTAPIVGATKLSHINDAARAVELKLDAEELRALAEPYRPHPVLGHT
ncbi:aldo/keto reductase [Sorangium sp. So ce321]|uniref:aldo/keto reductase n=1 Tax=Sorangium sp. So ce321 TaxID=3133300 RepID=UPI003F5D9561